MNKFLFIFFSFSFAFSVHAQDIFSGYTALSIPDSFKTNANAVYRLDEGILDISSPSHYTFKVHQVVTILNAEGADHLHHVFRFNKFREVETVDITTYNSLGLMVK